jgi:hypothetical protein
MRSIRAMLSGLRGGGAIVRRTEVIMPTVKQLVVIAVAIAMAIVGASAFGIGAAEHSATGGIERNRALQDAAYRSRF